MEMYAESQLSPYQRALARPLLEKLFRPLLGRLGKRVSWMLVTGLLVMAAVANLALVDPIKWVQANTILTSSPIILNTPAI